MKLNRIIGKQDHILSAKSMRKIDNCSILIPPFVPSALSFGKSWRMSSIKRTKDNGDNGSPSFKPMSRLININPFGSRLYITEYLFYPQNKNLALFSFVGLALNSRLLQLKLLFSTFKIYVKQEVLHVPLFGLELIVLPKTEKQESYIKSAVCWTQLETSADPIERRLFRQN